MSTLGHLALVGLLRAPLRTAVRVLTIAAAVALLGAMILFVGHSLQTMTATSVRSVPLDWQGPVASYRAARRVASDVTRQPDVLQASAVATAPFSSVVHKSRLGMIRAGAGAIVAVPPGYLEQLRTFRFLRGTLKTGEIVFDQQLAATLQVEPGDVVTLTQRADGSPRRFRVSGVALVTAADTLFQPLNPLTGPAPAQPPANIAILPVATFARTLAPSLRAIPPVGVTAMPGTVAGTQWRVQAQVDPAALNGSPAHALRRAAQIRNVVERSLPGRVVFVDNLSESLTTAASDALYAEALYIMLAVPGALVALLIAYLAALGTVESDRRDLALLRARGASRRDLLLLAIVESLAIGVVAGTIATAVALGSVRLVGAGGISSPRVLVTLGVCIALAFLGALAARVAASLGTYRASISEGRRSSQRSGRPLWMRLYLDIACLALSGLVYWLTLRTGFSAVVNPDSNPTLSLSVYMFFAPALLWIGAALLLVRLRGRALAAVAARAAGGRATTWRGFLLVSAGRRGDALNRGLLVIGLLLAFGVNLAVFTATYDQQARIDAQLTLGADVVVTAPTGTIRNHRLEPQIASLPGVAGISVVDHSYAYVGPDLQDTFGINAATLPKSTSLRNSYFVGGSANELLAKLRATPDGVLVSQETVTDYSLRSGDLLKLRTLDRTTGRFHVVSFHVVGVVLEFPAAPRDSFMVANLAYLERMTHDPGPNVVFVKANNDPSALARRIAASTKTSGTLVKDIRQQTAQTTSSITAVDLTGIKRIEEAFVLFLAAAAMALFVSVALAERRHELATMAALGAPLQRVAAFLWSEAALVLVASLALAALLGWLLTEMLVAMLRHVFDPPPDHLTIPWLSLGLLIAAAVVGSLAAVALAIAGLRRLQLGTILREE